MHNVAFRRVANEFTKEFKDLLYDVEVVRNIVRATVSDKILKGLKAWFGGGGIFISRNATSMTTSQEKR